MEERIAADVLDQYQDLYPSVTIIFTNDLEAY